MCSDYRCGFSCDCVCTGDCDHNAAVTIGELLTAVNVALNDEPATACFAAMCDCHPGESCGYAVSIGCLVRAVGHALDGCARSATRTPTPPLGGLCDPALNGPIDGPPPGQQVVFRLTDESTITLPDGSVESLRGSLLASECLSPNTFFADRIEAQRFESDSVVVESGCAAIGYVVASTLYGGDTPVEFSSAVRIGGQLLTLSGRGPYAANPTARRLDVQLTAGTYGLHLVAIVDSTVNAGSDIPLCTAWGLA